MSLKSAARFAELLIREIPPTGESILEVMLRRIKALEAHVNDMEKRYSELENHLNRHAQGRTHKPSDPVLFADQESYYPGMSDDESDN